MDRKRTALVAVGVAVVFVSGSSAFAFASELFVARPVDRVGTFHTIQARLEREVGSASTSTTGYEVRVGPSTSGPSTTTAVPTSTIGAPSLVSTTARSVEPNDPPDVEPLPRATVAQTGGGSASTTTHDADDGADEPRDDRGSDD